MGTGRAREPTVGQITDMLSGYRAFSRRYVKSFPALSQEFEIETEMTIHSLHLRLPVTEVLVGFKDRPAGGESKLRTYRDGWRILRWIINLMRHERPTLFHTIIAGLMGAVAFILAIPVVLTYMDTGLVPRLPTAVLALAIGIIAVVTFAAGYLIDAIRRSREDAARLAYLRYPAPRYKDNVSIDDRVGYSADPAINPPTRLRPPDQPPTSRGSTRSSSTA